MVVSNHVNNVRFSDFPVCPEEKPDNDGGHSGEGVHFSNWGTSQCPQNTSRIYHGNSTFFSVIVLYHKTHYVRKDNLNGKCKHFTCIICRHFVCFDGLAGVTVLSFKKSTLTSRLFSSDRRVNFIQFCRNPDSRFQVVLVFMNKT